MTKVTGVNKAARELGVTHVALLNAIKAGSIKPPRSGKLTVAGIKRSEWYRNRLERAEQAVAKSAATKAALGKLANIDKIDLEKLVLVERRESLRLDNEERKKNLLPADEVRGAMEAVISTTRSHLLLLPAKLAHKVSSLTDPAECQAVIDAEIKAALKALSETTFNK